MSLAILGRWRGHSQHSHSRRERLGYSALMILFVMRLFLYCIGARADDFLSDLAEWLSDVSAHSVGQHQGGRRGEVP
jgi:hypothetical protein